MSSSSPSSDESLLSPSPPTAVGLSDVSSLLLIKIMSPTPGFPRDVSFRLPPNSTIKQVKECITTSLVSRPPTDRQRLIYRGKMMQDENVLESVLGLPAGTCVTDASEAFTFHLMIRPPTNISTPTQPTGIPVEPTSLGNIATPPVTSTTNNTSGVSNPTNVSSPYNMLRYHLVTPEELQQYLQRRDEYVARRFSEAETESGLGISIPGVNDIRSATGNELDRGYGSGGFQTLYTTSPSVINGGGASGVGDLLARIRALQVRYDRIAQELRNLRAGGSLDTQAAGGQGGSGLRTLQDQREEAEQIQLETDTPTESSGPEPVFRNIQQGNMPVFSLQNDVNTITENNLIYLLQDTSGRPRALLVGPPGSVGFGSLARSMDDLRRGAGLPIDGPIGVNLPDLRELGLPLVPNAAAIGGNGLFPALGDHFGGARHYHQNHHRAGLQGAGALERPRIQVVRQINLREVLQGVVARASHLWLALRLAVFVVLFAGGGGWRRTLYLGSIAVLIFIWQTGIFDSLLRPLVEAINPPPAPLQQPAGPAQPPQQDNPLRPPPQAGGDPADPRQLAQALFARRQARFENIFRGIERVVMIFLTSLVPGLHERHVNAVEQRQRDAAQRGQLHLQQPQQPEGRGEQPPPAPLPEPQQEDEVEPEPIVIL